MSMETNRSRQFAVLTLLLFWQASPAQSAESRDAFRGIVVEEVATGSALELAGIQPGDVLTAWRRFPDPPTHPDTKSGRFSSTFDWMWLKLEQAPRGPVKLFAVRDGKPIEFSIEPGRWAAEVRPWLDTEQESLYRQGLAQLRSGNATVAQGLWSPLTTADRDWRIRCWLWLRLAKSLVAERHWEKAIEVLHRAQAAAGEPFAESVIKRAVGNLFLAKKEPELARRAYEQALEIRTSAMSSDELAIAEILTDLGIWSAEKGQLAEAEKTYEQVLEMQRRCAPDSLNIANTYNNLAIVAFSRGHIERAVALNETALAIRQARAPESLDLAASYSNLALALQKRGEYQRAKGLLELSLQIRRRLAPESNSTGISLNNLGTLEMDLGNLDRAEQLFEDALSAFRQNNPGSRDEANALNNLGLIATTRGQLGSARELHQESLRIRRQVAPGSLAVAASLNNLGIVAYNEGDLLAATTFLKQAFEIQEKRAPEGTEVARSLQNISFILMRRGHLAEARGNLEHALRIARREAPGSLSEAWILENLGSLFSQQKARKRAARYYERAHEIIGAVAPDSLEMAHILKNLGAAAGRAGDTGAATSLFENALEIQRRKAPESPAVRTILLNLGVLNAEQRLFKKAESFFREAFEIQEKQSPKHPDMAEILVNWAKVELETGNPEAASTRLHRALSIHSEWMPEKLDTADTLHYLGKCELNRRPPNIRSAKAFLDRALHVLEQQWSLLGGSSEVRVGFHAQNAEIYTTAIEVEIELGNLDRAFHISERYRARAFLEQLTERDSVFTADLPEELDRDRRMLAARFDRAQREIAASDSQADKDRIEILRQRMEAIRDDADDVEEKIRRISPKLASLHYPEALDIKKTRAILDPGTSLLSYVVGDERSYIFVVAKDRPLKVYEIAGTKEQLRRRIHDLSTKTYRQGWRRRTASRLEASKALYQILVEPAESDIRQSKRLLIIKDGPLHHLAFAALVRSSGADAGRPWQYLVEWKPLHSVLSATVYGELRNGRRTGGAMAEELVAFADPHYPGELRRPIGRKGSDSEESWSSIVDPHVRSAAERGSAFLPLPYTRLEATGIAKHYPGAEIFLGDEATEERVKSICKDTRILHLATHGTLDPVFPLNSAVALSMPEKLKVGQENGLLQAWEIFERVRIDADLVVLSACESGLGQEQGGEGLIGLTRAFQYAGARSVIASLWKVPDDPVIASLMDRFYRHLREGYSKDEALRAAQIALIHAPIEVRDLDGTPRLEDATAPYYWAAFQLFGDWR